MATVPLLVLYFRRTRTPRFVKQLIENGPSYAVARGSDYEAVFPEDTVRDTNARRKLLMGEWLGESDPTPLPTLSRCEFGLDGFDLSTLPFMIGAVRGRRSSIVVHTLSIAHAVFAPGLFDPKHKACGAGSLPDRAFYWPIGEEPMDALWRALCRNHWYAEPYLQSQRQVLLLPGFSGAGAFAICGALKGAFDAEVERNRARRASDAFFVSGGPSFCASSLDDDETDAHMAGTLGDVDRWQE